MSNNYVKGIVKFNFIFGFSGILVLSLLVVLMRYTRRFVNIFFMLPHIILYMFVINIGYLLLMFFSERIEKRLGCVYSLKSLYMYVCVCLNLLLGLAFIFEFSIY